VNSSRVKCGAAMEFQVIFSFGFQRHGLRLQENHQVSILEIGGYEIKKHRLQIS
jgi:hypothetical protein